MSAGGDNGYEDEAQHEAQDDRDRRAEAIGEELPGGNEGAPPADFTTFVLSFTNSALLNLGISVDPEGGMGKPERNLPLAKHTIELIELLEERTRGNLTGEEERLIYQVLVDLRKRYLQAYEGQGSDT